MERRILNNRTLLSRIKKIEEKFSLDQREDVVVVWSFGPDDEPHGKFGYRKFHIYTGLKEACTEEEEIQLLREAYEKIPPEARDNIEYWTSFESFLEHQRCECPIHRADVDVRAAEIQKLLKDYDEILEKAAREHIRVRELEILNRAEEE
jgi:hypothetical protein